MKVFIDPKFAGPDKAEGGIRRVVEAQNRYLPQLGVQIAEHPAEADVISVHAGLWMNTRQPIVSHCHGLYWYEYEWPRWAIDMNREVVESLRRADETTAPSEWVARILRRGMWLRPTVLYHGIEPEEWTPGQNQGYVLWNKTRVDPVCDPGPMIDLAARVDDVEFVSTFGLQASNFTVTGPRPIGEAREYIRNAGVYLSTTRETFGIGTLEAMACGVPVLGWNWGANPEIVEHGVTGWLATPGDIDGLVEGLEYIRRRRDDLGAAARERVLKDFTWSKVMERYIPVYERAIQARQGGPKVSVVIPAYNLDKLLPDAVESVVKQVDFRDWEIVIVNDASTDSTGAVADAFAEASNGKVRVVHHETNQYLAQSLNDGIAAARGEYIVPLDADNMLGEHALRELAAALDADRTIDIVYGAMQVIEEDGREWVSGWPPENPSFDEQLRMKRNQLPSTSMYRARAIRRVGGYRTRWRTAEDAENWCRMLSYGAVAKKATYAITLRYRNRADSMSHVEEEPDWTAWFPWSRMPELTPFGAAVPRGRDLAVPTYEPPLVAVVIPVGPGHKRYLMDAIDSVVGQTFQKWECIVVNDSGEDLGWLPPFVTLLSTPTPRSGPSVARNIGIAASSARAFVPLDADDYLQPSAIENMYSTWRDVGGNHYIYGDWYVQEDGSYQAAPDYEVDLVTRQLPHAVTALYPRVMWEAVGGFDEEMTAWEDWEFVFALAVKGCHGIRYPDAVMQYRLTTGGRREDMFERRGELERQMLDKWGDYIQGRKKLMPCSSCGNRGVGAQLGMPTPQQTQSMAAQGAPQEGMTLLEYVGDQAPTLVFRGAVTQTAYRFGTNEDVKERYVFNPDVPGLLARGDFRNAKERSSDPVLAAPGPRRK